MMPWHNRRRVEACKDWCFTLINWTTEMEETCRQYFDQYCAYWNYGKETGEKGTRHLQGFIQLKTKARMGTVKNPLTIRQIHLEKRRGTPTKAATHCKKDGDWTERGVMQAAGCSAGLIWLWQ